MKLIVDYYWRERGRENERELMNEKLDVSIFIDLQIHIFTQSKQKKDKSRNG